MASYLMLLLTVSVFIYLSANPNRLTVN